MNRFLFAISAIGSLLVTQALAGPPGHLLIDQSNAAVAFTTPYDGKDALVIIRYPASVDPDAENRFSETYNGRGFENLFYHPKPEQVLIPWIGQEPPNVMPQDMENADKEAIAKTAYFALGLYEALRKTLPAGAVRLQPVSIGMSGVQADESGAVPLGGGWPNALIERAAMGYAPAPIYIDVFAFVDPYWRSNKITTEGDKIAPLLSIRTAPEAAPSTGGALVTMASFLPYIRQPDQYADAANGAGATMVEYLSGIEGVPANFLPLPVAAITDKMPIRSGSVLVLPTISLHISSDQISESNPAESAIFSDYKSIIISAINAVPYDVATRSARTAYIALFDSPLAQRWKAGQATSVLDLQKIQLLRHFEQAEWQLIGKEDDHFVASVYHGVWGSGMRNARKGEQQFANSEQSARNSANLSLMMGTMSNLSSMSTRASSPQMALQNNINVLKGDISLMQQMQQSNTQMNKEARAFSDRMRDFSNESVQFLFSVGNGGTEIQAQSLVELRTRMKALYLKAYPVGDGGLHTHEAAPTKKKHR